MLQRVDHPVDVDRALALSERWRSEVVVARAVELAWNIFCLPETAINRWALALSPSERERRALRTYLDLDMGFAARSYAALRVVPGIRQKAAFASALAFPDRRYGAGRHDGYWRRWRSAARQIVRLRQKDHAS
jgi:hypothetical protein